MHNMGYFHHSVSRLSNIIKIYKYKKSNIFWYIFDCSIEVFHYIIIYKLKNFDFFNFEDL